MQSNLSNWSSIIKFSSIQFILKATFGTVNNIIFYNIFGPAILALIKLSEVIISLPQFLNVGISNALMVESININNKNLITNFLLVKLITFILVSIFILTDEFLLNIFIDFSYIQKLFLVFLVLITIVYNFSVANNFIEGSIHKIPLINSFVILVSPFLTISLGYYFLFDGWFLIQFITFLIPIIYILVGSYKKILKQLDIRNISSRIIKNLFKKSPIFFFNTKIFYITELIIFVLMASSIGLVNAGLIAFCFRFVLLIQKLVGQVFQKRFFWLNISKHNSGEDISKSSFNKIMQLSYMLVISLPVIMLLFMLLVELALPKYHLALDIISLSCIIIFSELVSGDLIRRLFILKKNKFLFINLIFNIIFLVILFVLISNYSTDFQQIFWYVSIVWFSRVVLILSLSLNTVKHFSQIFFVAFSSLFTFLFGLYFSYLNEDNILISANIFYFLAIFMIVLISFIFYILNKNFVFKIKEIIISQLYNFKLNIKHFFN